MAREFHQCSSQFDAEPEHRLVWVVPLLPDLHVIEAFAPASPCGVCKKCSDIFREPERLANVSDRTARTVVDDGRDDRGAVATVAAIDILHHLFATRVLEIDID